MIPPSQNPDRCKRNDNQYHWLHSVFDAMNSELENLTWEEACKDLLLHIRSTSNYNSVFKEVAKHFGLVNAPMLDPYTTFAIQSDGNMSNTQMRDLRRNLRAKLGYPIFAPEIIVKKLIGCGYIAPSQVGVFHYMKECIPWSVKDVDQLVLAHLTDYFNHNPNMIT